jgi:hypothetical protein
LLWRFSLFVFSLCLRHINISDFMNFTLFLHKRERKIYIIYPLYVLILQLFYGYIKFSCNLAVEYTKQ